MSRAARLAIAWTVVLFVGFSLPGVRLPDVPVLWTDKLVHAVLFAVLTCLWTRAFPNRPWSVAVWCVAFGVWVEIWQSLAPIGRMGDFLDVLADAVGVALGLGAALFMRRPVAPTAPSSR